MADIGQGAVATDEIANNQVKAADIGTGEVRSGNVSNENLTGGDIPPNSLKGADIDEGSLAGGLISGIATSGLVKSSGVVRVDLRPGEIIAVRPLISSGPFTIEGRCTNTTSGDTPTSLVRLESQADDFSMDSEGVFGDTVTDGAAGDSGILSFQPDVPATQKAFDTGDYAAIAPGKLLTGEFASGVHLMGNDCVFAATGIG